MPTPPDRRGLFLDLDGTLADSLGVLRRSYFRFLREFNQEGSDAEFDRLNGPKLSEIIGTLQREYHLPRSQVAREMSVRYRACSEFDRSAGLAVA
jgi:phosphoglycolate phosphatase-like HAD superfamily hydrolase